MALFDLDRIRSLRLTIVLYVVLPLVVVLGIAGYLAHRGLEDWVESRMQEEVRIVARAIQEPLSRSLRRDRLGAVDELLESAFRLSEVYAVQIYGPDGEEIAAVGVLHRPGGGRLDEMIESGEEGGEYGQMAGRDVYSYFASLSGPGGRPIGLLHVSRRRSDFERTFTRLRLQSGALLLGGTLLVIGLVMVGHHRSVGRHLRGLADDMARIEAGDRDHRASTEAPRETAALARGLNSMLDSLASARREIERHQDAQTTLEHRLQRTEKMAAIGQLAAGVAHELGSPLSVVDGKAQRLLRREDLDGEVGERLTEIRRQVRRMEGIVNRLLEFGQRKAARRERVRVGALVRGAVASVKETMKMSGTTLEVSGADEDPEILVERGQMIRALANLLRNAAQASPGGRVRLTWSAEDGAIRFVVEDDGPGIDPGARDRIFEPFFTTRAVGEGAGLGLAVVHGTALDHGGRVEVGESSLGGARFELLVSRGEDR